MKNLIIISLLISSLKSYSQDCQFYDEANYVVGSGPINMNIGDVIINDLNGSFFTTEEPAWKLPGNNADIKIEVLNPPQNYPFMMVYSSEDAPEIFGSDDYENIGRVKVSCVARCNSENCMPQPTAWIPLDRMSTINWGGEPSPASAAISRGHDVLLLRKLFLYDNSEDLGCPHGPWAEIVAKAYPASLLNNNSLLTIKNFWGLPSNSYSPLGGRTTWKVPGQVYTANNPCIGDDPESEWIDGPWGVCYSNMVLFDWTLNPNLNNYSLVLTESDATNPEDFLGGKVISKNTTGRQLVKFWHFGWAIVENIKSWQGDKIVDYADHYWMNEWDGTYYDNNIHKSPIGPSAKDQYLPLPQKSINQMEASFSSNKTIGLLGGTFKVTGKLDKPMKYVAPCEPAKFNN